MQDSASFQPGRNNRLTQIAGGLRRAGQGEAEILASLLVHPERAGLPEAEVRAIARSICAKYPPGQPRREEDPPPPDARAADRHGADYGLSPGWIEWAGGAPENVFHPDVQRKIPSIVFTLVQPGGRTRRYARSVERLGQEEGKKPKRLAVWLKGAGTGVLMLPGSETPTGGALWFTESCEKGIAIASLGFNAVCVPGANLFKPELVRLTLERFQPETLGMALDNDADGLKGTAKAAGFARAVGFTGEIRVVAWPPDAPEHWDIGDTLREHGPDAARALLQAAPIMPAAAAQAAPAPEPSIYIAKEVKPSPPPLPPTITAEILAAKVFTEPLWIIRNLIPTGFAMLVSRPKLGKSWMTHDFALSVAFGGCALSNPEFQAARGEVLLLPLEDCLRRLQSRLNIVLQGEQPPPGLHIATQWPRATEGGLDALRRFHDTHPALKLIVIDTLARFRSARKRNDDSYQADYDFSSSLQQIAMERQIGILGVHHQRKAEGADIMDSVSGTLGLTGAADTLLILTRARSGADAVLHTTGRDIEEAQHALKFKGGLWQFVGDAENVALSPVAAKVVEVIRRNTEGLYMRTLLTLMPGYESSAVKAAAYRLAEKGLVQNIQGRFTPSPNHV